LGKGIQAEHRFFFFFHEQLRIPTKLKVRMLDQLQSGVNVSAVEHG
jgi:hypothetical protein